MVPVVSWIGLAACSDLAGTAGEQTMAPYRVATYMDDSKPRSDRQPIDPDLGFAYEWFY